MSENETQLIDDLIERARVAQQKFEKNGSQAAYDQAALAVGWAIMEPKRNAVMAQMAVDATGLGKVSDKIIKNHRKTLGLLRDIKSATTFGLIERNSETGITKFARAKGVVGAVVPSTNPVATPANNIINALKCGNSIIVSPSPAGITVCETLFEHIYAEFDKNGIDKDLVLMVPGPASKAKTQRLMEACDLLVVTGSQDNVRRAYKAGTPALGVGAGNVTVIVDETADLKAAAEKITASKTFDNATSCSSENELVVLDEIYDVFMQELHKAGGRLLNDADAQKVKTALFQNGKLNRYMIARDLDQVCSVAGIELAEPDGAKFLVIKGEGIGKDFPESGEKLALVATLYRAKDFEAAKGIASEIMSHLGAGHSVGIHSDETARAEQLGRELPTCRVIVNQAHCFATGGAFNNGMPFSLSMGCGSWGGNSIDDNLNYQHFMNITKIVHPITPNEPSVDDIFADYKRTVA